MDKKKTTTMGSNPNASMRTMSQSKLEKGLVELRNAPPRGHALIQAIEEELLQRNKEELY